MPVYYQCQRCTACCRWPGQVKLTEAEIIRLADFKGMSEYHFIQAFTRLQENRQGLALLEKNNGECIFLKGNDCSVQPVKPQQCRDFPNRWNFPGFQDLCHATAKLVSQEEYDRLVSEPSPNSVVAALGRVQPFSRSLP